MALVKLKDYNNLIVDENGRLRRHLFEWNVRDYQGNVAVNQDIRKSLTVPDSPEFWWLNNGVTIICSDATSAGKTYSLSDIQIVNGCGSTGVSWLRCEDEVIAVFDVVDALVLLA